MFRLNEINYAIFFLCEIEINYGKIKNNLVDEISSNLKYKKIFYDKIIKNNKFR